MRGNRTHFLLISMIMLDAPNNGFGVKNESTLAGTNLMVNASNATGRSFETT